MWSSLRRRVSRLLFGRHDSEDYRERLVEARSELDKEASAMKRDVGTVGDKIDPIGTIIRNIRQVRGRQ